MQSLLIEIALNDGLYLILSFLLVSGAFLLYLMLERLHLEASM